MHKTSMMENM